MLRRGDLADRTFRMHQHELLVGEGEHFAALTDGSAVIAGRRREWSTIGLYRLRGAQLAECWLVPFDQAEFDSIWSGASGQGDQGRGTAFEGAKVEGAVSEALRYVNPTAHRGPIYRAFVRLASSRFATWLATKPIWSAVVWRIDPHLMRLTRGRLGTGLMLPTALLQTRGARTGLVRRNAVIYFHDGDRVIIFASQAGRPENPSWYYNARANPDVALGGEHFRVELVEGEMERARLFALAERVLPAFASYRESADRAGRTIPILQLTPRDRLRPQR
jgi:deazaflavin-dependent oxidoreductase (nitroreductase family)